MKPTRLEWDNATRAPDESLDALFDGNIGLFQSRLGYRFSIDALLLASFVSVRRNDRILDLGCGNAVVSLALARLHRSAEITGVELQSGMAERARRNVRMNGFEGRVTVVTGDVRKPHGLLQPGGFDVAVCNPPYRKPGSGRVSGNDERRIARHELNGEVGDFLRTAAALLREKGRMALVYLSLRSADLICEMRRAGIEPKRLRMVHSFRNADATLALVEGVKGGRANLTVLPPLTIYARDKSYSDEVKAIISGARNERGTA